jgi:hypothetical protein
MNARMRFLLLTALVPIALGGAAALLVALLRLPVSAGDAAFVGTAYLLPALPCALLCAWWLGARRLDALAARRRSAFALALRIAVATFVLHGCVTIGGVTPAAFWIDREWIPLVRNPWGLLAAGPVFMYAVAFAFVPALLAGWLICTHSLQWRRFERECKT